MAVEVIVLGGGAAGLVSASILADLGKQVTLIDNGFGAKPQWDHIHLLEDEPWQDLCELVPGFEQALIDAGAASGAEVLLQRDLSSSAGKRVRPSRRLIDETLFKILPKGVTRVSARVASLELNEFGVEVALEDGHKCHGTLLIDASGRGRASLSAIARIQGTQAELHQGPAGGSYVSAIAEGPYLPNEKIALRTRYEETGVLLLKEENSQWRLTLQLENHCSGDSAKDELQKIISSSIQVGRHNLFSGTRIVGEPFLFGSVRAEYLAWSESAIRGIPWIILGDALLTTPPWLGWGFAQLTNQVQLLRQGLRDCNSIDDIRSSIQRNARDAWLQATMKETLRGLMAA